MGGSQRAQTLYRGVEPMKSTVSPIPVTTATIPNSWTAKKVEGGPRNFTTDPITKTNDKNMTIECPQCHSAVSVNAEQQENFCPDCNSQLYTTQNFVMKTWAVPNTDLCDTPMSKTNETLHSDKNNLQDKYTKYCQKLAELSSCSSSSEDEDTSKKLKMKRKLKKKIKKIKKQMWQSDANDDSCGSDSEDDYPIKKKQTLKETKRDYQKLKKLCKVMKKSYNL